MAFPVMIPVSIVPDISSAAPDPITIDPYVVWPGGYALLIDNICRLFVDIAGCAARSCQGGSYCNDK
jgi:hypothetical protein